MFRAIATLQSERVVGTIILDYVDNQLCTSINLSKLSHLVKAALHIGLRGHSGPVVATIPLEQSSVDSRREVVMHGTVKPRHLVGCFEHEPLSLLVKEMKRGHIYVTLTTIDDVVRGQVEQVRVKHNEMQSFHHRLEEVTNPPYETKRHRGLGDFKKSLDGLTRYK